MKTIAIVSREILCCSLCGLDDWCDKNVRQTNVWGKSRERKSQRRKRRRNEKREVKSMEEKSLARRKNCVTVVAATWLLLIRFHPQYRQVTFHMKSYQRQPNSTRCSNMNDLGGEKKYYAGWQNMHMHAHSHAQKPYINCFTYRIHNSNNNTETPKRGIHSRIRDKLQ